MREVVDLVSSDDEPPAKTLTITRKHVPNASIAIKEIPKTAISNRPIDADFDLTLDDDEDFPWARKAKRRKFEGSLPILQSTDLRRKPGTQQNVSMKEKRHTESTIAALEVDDIVFTSPAQQKTSESTWTAIGSQNDVSENSPASKNWTGLSTRTAALLKEISTNPTRKKSKKSGKDKADDIQDDETSNSSDNDRPRLTKPTTDKLGAKEKAEQKAAREAEQAQRRQEKASRNEEAKQHRAEARIAKVAEKQRAADLAAVNRSKLDKNVTTPEMIVDFPTSMEGTSSLTQCREFLRTANSETSLYTGNITGIIKFRRKIQADFNDELGYMERVEPRIDDERTIILYLPAEDFACLVSPFPRADETLVAHLTRVRSLYSGYRIIYLIEGLERLIAKEKNASNRAYQAAVRRAAAAAAEKEQQTVASAGANDTPSTRKSRNKSLVIVDEAAIDAALLSLQIEHSVQIHQCLTPLDTGETVLAMTQQLSLSRYRDPPILSAAQMALQPNFCMSTGQVPTGKSLDDTYLKVLQQVIRVTEREAKAIAKVHPHLGSLFAVFRARGGKALEDIMKEGGGAKSNGALAAERRIGPASSERLFRIFLGSKAEEMIG